MPRASFVLSCCSSKNGLVLNLSSLVNHSSSLSTGRYEMRRDEILVVPSLQGRRLYPVHQNDCAPTEQGLLETSSLPAVLTPVLLNTWGLSFGVPEGPHAGWGMGCHPTTAGNQHEEEVPGCCGCAGFFNKQPKLLFLTVLIVKLPLCQSHNGLANVSTTWIKFGSPGFPPIIPPSLFPQVQVSKPG